LKVAESTKDK